MLIEAVRLFVLALIAMMPSPAASIDYCAPESYTGAIIARDGQMLAAQPLSVREIFERTWGEEAAARWVFERNCALSQRSYPHHTPALSPTCPASTFTGAVAARDERSLAMQELWIQVLFVETWGKHAAARWAYEHNCGLPTPEPASEPEPAPAPEPEPAPAPEPASEPAPQHMPAVDPWHGYGSWWELCAAFFDYRVPPTWSYKSGTQTMEAITHPLFDRETSAYGKECHRLGR